MKRQHFLGALAALLLVGGARAEDLPLNTNGIKHENVVIRGAQVFNGCSEPPGGPGNAAVRGGGYRPTDGLPLAFDLARLQAQPIQAIFEEERGTVLRAGADGRD